ncbi:peptidylprolyl isomerase [Methyloceanibacter sp.]|uniref:peptidylprolyl isomerase n=1 Tax=Methyloceanibacter sp. TaxID=1965321 RepID=UPI003D6D49E4
MMFTRLFAVAAVLAAVACATPRPSFAADPLDNVLLLDLKDGRVTILLRPDLAPKHVERVKKLTREGFYDGIVFHRVIPGFMAQTGDPTGTGTGGSQYPDLPAEFTNKATFERGTVGAARSNDPNSANSQFFIDLDAAPFLNGKYTIWGQVIGGQDAVDKIKPGEPPSNPDKIVKMQIAADADDASKQAAAKALQAQQ